MIIIGLLSIYSVLLNTFRAAFGISVPYDIHYLNSCSENKNECHIIIHDLLIEILFWIDLVQNFFREYEDENSPVPIREFNLIAVKYLKGSFLYDFLSIFPFVMIIDSNFKRTK